MLVVFRSNLSKLQTCLAENMNMFVLITLWNSENVFQKKEQEETIESWEILTSSCTFHFFNIHVVICGSSQLWLLNMGVNSRFFYCHATMAKILWSAIHGWNCFSFVTLDNVPHREAEPSSHWSCHLSSLMKTITRGLLFMN